MKTRTEFEKISIALVDKWVKQCGRSKRDLPNVNLRHGEKWVLIHAITDALLEQATDPGLVGDPQ